MRNVILTELAEKMLLLHSRSVFDLNQHPIGGPQYYSWVGFSIKCLKGNICGDFVLPQDGREQGLHLHHCKFLTDAVPIIDFLNVHLFLGYA